MAKSKNKTQNRLQALKVWCLFVLAVSVCMSGHADEHVPDVETIVKKIDQLYRSETSHAEMEMHIVTPHWERTLAMTVWTQGMRKTFIRITAPKKEQGVATLRIGNEMWNYLPKTNKTMKIPPSMMMGSWMGSDFTNDDLVRESSMLDDYTYQYVTPKDASPGHLYIQLVPKEDSPIVWGKIVAAVQSDDYMPVWQRFYDGEREPDAGYEFQRDQNFWRQNRAIRDGDDSAEQRRTQNGCSMVKRDLRFGHRR